MSNLSKLKKYAKDPLLVLLRYLCNHPSWFSDESYVKIKYRYFTGRHLNLNNPKTFNEKLQWLKLYNHNPLYTQLVDKIEVKKYVESVIGGYTIPTIMTWDSVDNIDWDVLPSSFVIKCNHDSGGIIICKDKSALNIKKAKEILSYHLSHDNYSITREWPYKDVQKRLLCEPYIEDSDTGELRDYKFFCFSNV